MKKFIKDWWPLLLIAGWWLWKKTSRKKGLLYKGSRDPNLDYTPNSSNQPKDPLYTPQPDSEQHEAPVESAGGSVINYNGKTYYAGGPIGKTSYDDAAAYRAQYNSCPTHGTSTMRHYHTYNQGRVEDYYQCTVCGHRNTVYVK